jgi:hypothetical protein
MVPPFSLSHRPGPGYRSTAGGRSSSIDDKPPGRRTVVDIVFHGKLLWKRWSAEDLQGMSSPLPKGEIRPRAAMPKAAEAQATESPCGGPLKNEMGSIA